MRHLQRVGLAAFIAVAVYVSAYALAKWQFRQPAANMAYFVYSGRQYSGRVDCTMYYLFFPVYAMHKHWVGASFVKHNLDRQQPDETMLGP